jgi:hypothetical protein
MKSDTAIWIAGYAATIATLVLCWNIITWRINRGRIKFEIREVFQIDRGDFCIEYKVLNTGEKPVTIEAIGYTVGIKGRGSSQLGRGTFIVNDLPKRLDGHSSFLHFRKTPDIFAPGARVVTVFVEDALGKKYKANKNVVQKLARNHKMRALPRS